MAETSFPVLGAPLTDLQWGQVTRGLGDGILADGGDAYAHVTRDNVANTITLAVPADKQYSQAILRGFYHRIDSNVVLSCPAVSVDTTYYIGLVYDPTKHADPAGPVRLSVTTTIPTGGRKVYLPLHELDRKPNQLITDAVTRDRRVYVSPSLTVKTTGTFPDPKTQLIGTRLTDLATGQQWRIAEDQTWQSAGDAVTVLNSGAPIRGGAVKRGAPWIQGGVKGVTTNASGDATIIFDTPFPSGLMSVTITPYDIGSGGPRYVAILSLNTDASRVSFRTFDSTGKATDKFPHSVSWIAMGW